jgi:hypothetical protein
VSPRARKAWIAALLLALAAAGAVAWVGSRPPLDLKPLAERFLVATEQDVGRLLRETALKNAWSMTDLRGQILARRIQLGEFKGWLASEPLVREDAPGRPRQRLVATAAFERAPAGVRCTFHFVHRPGGWVLADFDVPVPTPAVRATATARAREVAEELVGLALGRRFEELYLRLGRRARREESSAALDQRLRPVLEGLGRFSTPEVTSFEPVEPGHRLRARTTAEGGQVVEVLVEIEFESTAWVGTRVELRRP